MENRALKVFPSLMVTHEAKTTHSKVSTVGKRRALGWWWGEAAVRALHRWGTAGSKSAREERDVSARGAWGGGATESCGKHRDHSKALRLPWSRCPSATQKPRTASLRSGSCCPLSPNAGSVIAHSVLHQERQSLWLTPSGEELLHQVFLQSGPGDGLIPSLRLLWATAEATWRDSHAQGWRILLEKMQG